MYRALEIIKFKKIQIIEIDSFLGRKTQSEENNCSLYLCSCNIFKKQTLKDMPIHVKAQRAVGSM